MANNFYNSYQGSSGGLLPAGYMEAATAPGRAIGAGIASMGAGIGRVLQTYMKNKEEDQYLTSKLESMLAPYAEQGPTPDGQTRDISVMSSVLGEKNVKKFVEGKASRMDKLAMANALEVYEDKQYKQGQLKMQELQGRLMEEALRDRQRQAESALRVDSLMGQPASATRNVSGMLSRQVPMSGPMPLQGPDPESASVQQIRQSLQPDPSILGDSDLLGRLSQFTQGVVPQAAAPAEPPMEVPRPMVDVEEQVSVAVPTTWEDQRGEFTSRLAQAPGVTVEDRARALQLWDAMNPKPAMDPTKLGMKPKEMTVNGVKFEAPDEAALQARYVPDLKGYAPTVKAAEELKDAVKERRKVENSIQSLLTLADKSGSSVSIDDRALATVEVGTLKGSLRKFLIGPGAMSDHEQKLLESIIRNPTKIFSLDSANKKSLQRLREKTEQGFRYHAESEGFQFDGSTGGASSSDYVYNAVTKQLVPRNK
jgi:hypothetical protein